MSTGHAVLEPGRGQLELDLHHFLFILQAIYSLVKNVLAAPTQRPTIFDMQEVFIPFLFFTYIFTYSTCITCTVIFTQGDCNITLGFQIFVASIGFHIMVLHTCTLPCMCTLPPHTWQIKLTIQILHPMVDEQNNF